MEKKIVLFIVIGSVLFFTSCTNTEKEEIVQNTIGQKYQILDTELLDKDFLEFA